MGKQNRNKKKGNSWRLGRFHFNLGHSSARPIYPPPSFHFFTAPLGPPPPQPRLGPTVQKRHLQQTRAAHGSRRDSSSTVRDAIVTSYLPPPSTDTPQQAALEPAGSVSPTKIGLRFLRSCSSGYKSGAAPPLVRGCSALGAVEAASSAGWVHVEGARLQVFVAEPSGI